MVTVPAFVWRGGFVRRALITGASFGACMGVLGWVDSGVAAMGGIVFAIVGVSYGVWMARRMAKYWPESAGLTGDDRVTVVAVARGGLRVPDARLAEYVDSYRRGLHAAAQSAGPLRWLLSALLVVAIGMAVWDSMYGSWGNVVVSFVYLAALIVEVFWWPKRLNTLLDNANRAARECH